MGGWASLLASVSKELDSGFYELCCVFFPLVNLLADDVSCLSCGLRVSLETLWLYCAMCGVANPWGLAGDALMLGVGLETGVACLLVEATDRPWVIAP